MSIEIHRTASPENESTARRRMRAVGRMLGSLLLGGLTVLGSILLFRKGLLPLIEGAFHPGPEWLSVFRRAGILLSAVGGYWAFVHWHEKRPAAELRLRPLPLLAGGASGAAMVALPMAVLFACGVYECVLWRGASPGLLGVAAFIGIAATLEELTFRCLLFRIVERAWGTKWALAVQAVLFALQHLGARKGSGWGCPDLTDSGLGIKTRRSPYEVTDQKDPGRDGPLQ